MYKIFWLDYIHILYLVYMYVYGCYSCACHRRQEYMFVVVAGGVIKSQSFIMSFCTTIRFQSCGRMLYI